MKFYFGQYKIWLIFQDFLKIGVSVFSFAITCTNIADLTRITLSLPLFDFLLGVNPSMIYKFKPYDHYKRLTIAPSCPV